MGVCLANGVCIVEGVCLLKGVTLGPDLGFSLTPLKEDCLVEWDGQVKGVCLVKGCAAETGTETKW